MSESLREVAEKVKVMATALEMVSISIGKRLLNAREAARYLGLEVDTVYKKARLRTGSTAREMWRLMEADLGNEIKTGSSMFPYCSLG